MMVQYNSKSDIETLKIGESIGKTLKNGDIVCIFGELGAGKTILVNGIARSIGINEHLASPTFTIVNEYHGSVSLYHFDLYRINSIDELNDIGFFEYLSNDGIVIIEWAERVVDELYSLDYIKINIKKSLLDTKHREIRVENIINNKINGI